MPPYSLRAITSLDDIASVGTLTDDDSNLHYQTRLDIEAGKYEKVRYISSTGDQFCIWNVRLTDMRDGNLFYYWFAAPVGDKFSNGYMHSHLFGSKAADIDRSLTTVGPRISGSMNECMIDRTKASRWVNTYGGENERIYWNGKLLVNFYTLKAD